MGDSGRALSIRALSMHIDTRHGTAHPLRDVSLDVAPGEVVALAGESGSGKSTVLRSIVRLLPRAARTEGSVQVAGTEVTSLPKKDLRSLRARTVRMVFQDPWAAFHPMHTIGRQLVESARAADPGLSTERARQLAVETLEAVGVTDAPQRLRARPQEVSGGQLQRSMIAMCLVGAPRVLLCDEPTTALDVTTQAAVLDLLRDLADERGIAVLMSTHDLGLIREIADRVVIMYAGQVVEDGPVAAVLDDPRHPYTRALIAARPDPSAARLQPIPGIAPSATERVNGCAFAPRCPSAVPACREEDPPVIETDRLRRVRCRLIEGTAV
ncbi:ABC transporter ATP-binding protein [Streptomyces sp. NPDC052042]|uniref:ABC transporter ATP-binding protein n=1 Tax=Streptomyces sp. NPDC052042 TaxID=3365683 RepID=UPI0037CE3F73